MQLPEGMGSEDARKKDGAGNSDERNYEVKGFFYRRLIHSTDGAKIDQHTEPESEKQAERFDHAYMIANLHLPVNLAFFLSGFFLFDSTPSLN